MKGFRYFRNVSTLQLDAAACVGCARCVEVCPHQVVALDERKARVQNLDTCMECGACAKNCPTAAIRVDAGVGCAAGLVTEWLQERKIRTTAGGCGG